MKIAGQKKKLQVLQVVDACRLIFQNTAGWISHEKQRGWQCPASPFSVDSDDTEAIVAASPSDPSPEPA
jgi:hypothetical protein